MKKRIIIITIILLTFVFFVSYKALIKKQNNKLLTLYGNIEIRQVDLSFQVGGKLTKLFKEEGDIVKKGELVALIDDKDYDTNYKKAEAEVKRALAIKDDAQSKYERNSILGEIGAKSKQEIETLLNNKNKTSAEYDIAIVNKAYSKNQLDYTKLYAPEDGIVMLRIVEEGTTVAKGQGVYTIAKTKPVWVRAYINETDLGNIKYGQEVKVYTDTINPATNKKKEYKGQIGYISPVAEFTPKTVQTTDARTNLVYRIRVYIDNTDEFLRQGMPVTLEVDLN